MNRSLIILAICIALASCASDGTFASKSKPVDKAVTLEATCGGITKADVAFQAFVHARPDVIDPNGLAVEKAIMTSIQPFCVAPYRGDLDAATNVAINALIQISTLLATWQK